MDTRKPSKLITPTKNRDKGLTTRLIPKGGLKPPIITIMGLSITFGIKELTITVITRVEIKEIYFDMYLDIKPNNGIAKAPVKGIIISKTGFTI
jgi:hypothetical protein